MFLWYWSINHTPEKSGFAVEAAAPCDFAGSLCGVVCAKIA
jgi:hypothetical protein